MGTHVNLAGELVPDPISNAEPYETPAVGHIMTGDVWVPLDLTCPEANLSHGEMILYHLVRLLLHR